MDNNYRDDWQRSAGLLRSPDEATMISGPDSDGDILIQIEQVYNRCSVYVPATYLRELLASPRPWHYVTEKLPEPVSDFEPLYPREGIERPFQRRRQMLSDHDREFLREIGIAPDLGFSLIGGDDLSRCVQDCRIEWAHDAFSAPLSGAQADLARQLIESMRREMGDAGR